MRNTKGEKDTRLGPGMLGGRERWKLMECIHYKGIETRRKEGGREEGT